MAADAPAAPRAFLPLVLGPEIAREIGSRVVLVRLVSRADLNGKRGTVRSFDAEKGRFGIEVNEEEGLLALKPANLQTELWGAISGDVKARDVALVAKGLRRIASKSSFVVTEFLDPKNDPQFVLPRGWDSYEVDFEMMGGIIVARASTPSVQMAYVVFGPLVSTGLMRTLTMYAKKEKDVTVDRASTREQIDLTTLAVLESVIRGLERGEVPLSAAAVRDAMEALGRAELQAARCLLELAIPVIETAKGGPTKHTTHLRTVLGEFCEELKDQTSAIAAYVGVTTECACLLKPWHMLSRPGFEDGPPKEAAYGNLGLAYKRARKFDLGEACYREGLHGARQSDMSQGLQHLRWNLYRLLLDGERGDEKLQAAGTALFGGKEAIKDRLLPEMPRHTLAQKPEDIIFNFHGTQAVVRLCKDTTPVGKCLVIKSSGVITLQAAPPAPEKDPYQSFLNIKTKLKSTRDVMCDGCFSPNGMLDRAEIFKCPCHTRFYCTKECQKKAWPEHKKAHLLILETRKLQL